MIDTFPSEISPDAPLTVRGIQILWDKVVQTYEVPDLFLVSPIVYKRWKRIVKMSQRRDRRRKHPRHGYVR